MYMTGTGMVCSVGLSAASACAAMRAGISGFAELPYKDNQGEPIIGALVPEVPLDLRRNQRLIELLSRAITDCLKNEPAEPFDRIPLLVALAEPERPGSGARMAPTIIGQVEKNLNTPFHPTLSRTFPKGHISGFEALGYASRLFKTGAVSACLVCGVDSYLNASSLLWLDQHRRLKTAVNSDGVIPGEAAAAILIYREARRNSDSMTKLAGLGFATETAHVLAEEPLLGLGLAEAARTALNQAGFQMHEMDLRVSDVTGESYGFKEQALALGRLMRQRREELPIWHCADSIGDTGAAAGICELVVTKYAFTKKYAPGKQVLCYTSSVFGDRAAAVMQQVI
jgi:3-oxoacyl-[acyl-carrier-protein] synthase-1